MENQAGLSIGVLGPLLVRREGARRELPASRKTRGLLAYLALRERPCPRDELCDLLWEGTADPRSELRWSLAKIRAAVGGWLQVSPDGIALAGESLSVDGIAVRRLAMDSLSEQSVVAALALWRGPALGDVEVRGQRAFQAWVTEERESLSRVHTCSLKSAVDLAWARPETALSAARRLVGAEPWNQWGHARVIQLLERCGRFSEAAAYAGTTRERLSRELGVAKVHLQADPPATAKAVSTGQVDSVHRARRYGVRLENLKWVPRNDDVAAVGLRVSTALGIGLCRDSTCLLIDADGSPRDSARAARAEFAVRGSVVHDKRSTRVSLRCIDARCGAVVWFDQIEIDTGDFLRLDVWVEQAVKAIVGAVTARERELSDMADHPSPIVTARALAERLEPAANQLALRRLDEILKQDADDRDALALSAWCYAQRVVYNWSADPGADGAEAKYYAASATRVAANNPDCLTTIATARMLVGDPNGAEILLQRSLELDRWAFESRTRSGWLANLNDDPGGAARHFRAALKLAPYDSKSFNALAGLGMAHFIEGDYVQAIRRMEQALALNPQATWIYRNLVPAYSAAGERRKAEDGVSILMKSYPGLTVADVTAAIIFSRPVLLRFADGLYRAGLPR